MVAQLVETRPILLLFRFHLRDELAVCGGGGAARGGAVAAGRDVGGGRREARPFEGGFEGGDVGLERVGARTQRLGCLLYTSDAADE